MRTTEPNTWTEQLNPTQFLLPHYDPSTGVRSGSLRGCAYDVGSGWLVRIKDGQFFFVPKVVAENAAGGGG